MLCDCPSVTWHMMSTSMSERAISPSSFHSCRLIFNVPTLCTHDLCMRPAGPHMGECRWAQGIMCCAGALQAAGGRRMTGHEAFSASVSAPDGAVSAVPVVLAEGGAHYQATLQWLQTGIHKASVCGA